MLIEELFTRGVMTMGPCRNDPARQVGTFNAGFISNLPALRSAEMENFRWVAGDWNYENVVPASRANPAYTDVGVARFSWCEKDNWICRVTPDGRDARHITYDPFSRQWIYVLLEGAYGILRSASGWNGNQIVFSGLMTMIGVNCEWRMTWSKTDENRFGFVNEERTPDGSWANIDEWHFERR